MNLDTTYAIITLFFTIINAVILYFAFTGNKYALIYVCISLAFLHSDYVWKQRSTTFFYGFLKGMLSDD